MENEDNGSKKIIQELLKFEESRPIISGTGEIWELPDGRLHRKYGPAFINRLIGTKYYLYGEKVSGYEHCLSLGQNPVRANLYEVIKEINEVFPGVEDLLFLWLGPEFKEYDTIFLPPDEEAMFKEVRRKVLSVYPNFESIFFYD